MTAPAIRPPRPAPVVPGECEALRDGAQLGEVRARRTPLPRRLEMRRPRPRRQPANTTSTSRLTTSH